LAKKLINLNEFNYKSSLSQGITGQDGGYLAGIVTPKRDIQRFHGIKGRFHL